MYAPEPGDRLAAALGLSRRARKSLERHSDEWPSHSPGSLNAWLLLVTTKEPTWHDPLVLWRDFPPTLGAPHEGFFYPDPLGFWAEVRRWAHLLLSKTMPGIPMSTALSLSTLIHVGDDTRRIAWARSVNRPRVILFLDEPSWQASQLSVSGTVHQIPDPHRAGQRYEGFWGTLADGTIVGKAPQHPATHRLYRTEDLDGFLHAVPLSTDEHVSSGR